MKGNENGLRSGVEWFGCLAFASALASLVLNGFYTRYLADDYCYDVWFSMRNFWQAWITGYFLPNPFAGHRFSLTFFSGVGKLIGLSSPAWFTAFSVLFISVGIIWTIDGARRSFHIPLTWPEVVLSAEALITLTLFQAPNRYQILYWRTGLLTYLAPLVFQSFLYGLIFYQARRRPDVRWLVGVAVVIAMIATGFSETAGAFQATVLTLGLLVALWQRKAGSTFAARFLPTLSAALIATLLTLVIMFLCPTNAARMAVGQVQTYDPLKVLLMSGRFASDFLRDTFRGLPLPTALTIILFALKAITQGKHISSLSFAKALTGIISSFVVGFILLMAMIAPSVVAQSSFPELRALLIGRFALVLMFAGIGVFLGLMFLRVAQHFGTRAVSLVEPVTLFLLTILSLYAVRMAFQANRDLPAAQARAAAWDARDQFIRVSKDQGKQELVVNALDSVGRIFELQENPRHWVNQCAETFYGMPSISAVEQ